MKYTVRHLNNARKDFGSYGYIISHNGTEVVYFWHNYRGECENITIISSGKTEDTPFGMCSDFLTGGGSLPLGLTDEAEGYLEKALGINKNNSVQQGNAPEPATRRPSDL